MVNPAPPPASIYVTGQNVPKSDVIAWMLSIVEQINSEISGINVEIRDGRVYFASGMESPSGYEIPNFADMVITTHVASGRTRMWRARGAPSDGLETPTIVQSSNGRWFERIVEVSLTEEIARATAAEAAIIAEMRNGRVYYATSTTDPSGSDIPDWADFVTTGHNASGTTRDWRPRGAPEDGLETENIKLDANGRWWTRMRDASVGNAIRDGGIITTVNISGTGDAILADIAPAFIEAGVTSLGNASEVEYIPTLTNSSANPSLTIGGQTFGIRNADGGEWPAGGFQVGRSYKLRRRGNVLRVSSGDATAVEILALSTALVNRVTVDEYRQGVGALADQIAMPADQDWPGNEAVVLAIAENGVAAAVDGEGNLRGTLLTADSGWPGNWLTEDKVDIRGVVLEGYDIRTGEKYVPAIGGSDWPGNWVIPLVEDLAGVALFGVDVRDGSLYGAPEGGSDGDGGSGVKFVDPGFSGDAFGAAEDADGVIKFQTIVAPGVLLGMEKRGDDFFADTQSLAIAVLAIGGGDTGNASSVEEYKWHVFDETFEPQDTHNAASGLATAVLKRQTDNYKARSLMFPIAEVIGSTVEADVIAGAPRRVQLMSRLAEAKASAEAVGKTLMAGWLKLSLLSGAPATPFATAREHYGLVGNGMRLEAAEVTGQGAAPLLIVNQSFGTRSDGTSEVILAEGRLDWDYYSLGFVVPTPLYPFTLVPGTPATLTADALLMVRELETIALATLESGNEWFCPSLEEATIDGTTITARFASLTPLVLQDAVEHGFSFAESGAPDITGVSVSGSYATITLASAPAGDLTLQYAFGQTGDPEDGRAANRGSLTDDWSQGSNFVPGNTLYRYARSGRATVQ